MTKRTALYTTQFFGYKKFHELLPALQNPFPCLSRSSYIS